MSNHIQSRLTIVGTATEVKEIRELLRAGADDELRQIDFNKIIPMPEGLDIDHSGHIEMWIKICYGMYDFNSMFTAARQGESFADNWATKGFDSMINYMGSITAFEVLIGKRPGQFVKDFDDKDYETFIQALKNYRRHGYWSWYDWCRDKWGTKWNAYETEDERNTENTIFFQTANSAPHQVMQALSQKFPKITFRHAWANEDTGAGCGQREYLAGQIAYEVILENNSLEAYDWCFELFPAKRQDYKLIDGKYVQQEEEEE